MTRAFDFAIAAVVYIISVVIHRIAVELFGPSSGLHEIASEATLLNGAARADLWFKALSVWVPVAAVFGISAWVFVREYRRQKTTAVARGVR